MTHYVAPIYCNLNNMCIYVFTIAIKHTIAHLWGNRVSYPDVMMQVTCIIYNHNIKDTNCCDYVHGNQ